MRLILARASQRNTNLIPDEQALRDQLALLQARYDHGAVSLPVFAVIRQIEIELGWLAHRGEAAP